MPSGPVGEAPTWMTPAERESWEWIVARCAPGVLANSDDGILEITACLREQFLIRALDAKGILLLKACYGELGMTPASRSKVQAKPQQAAEVNEFAV